MIQDHPHARIGYRDGAMSRFKNLALKAIVVIGGAVALASAFAISLVILAIALAAVLVSGGYLWWKTRELRRQMRERVPVYSEPPGRIIEGEVISPDSARRGAPHRSP